MPEQPTAQPPEQAAELAGRPRQRVDLTGAKSTMLWTLYFRARDARTPQPLVDDRWAQPLLDRVDTSRLRLWLHASDRHMVLLRARQLDLWTKDFLARTPNAVVIQLGCGLDSRAYRLELPERVRWYDVDFPEVIELHRKLYPQKPNHRTIASSVTEPGWMSELPEDRPTLVIAEGSLPYIEGSEVRDLIERLLDRLPEGELMLDGVAGWMTRLTRLFHWGLDDPAVLEQWDNRIGLVESRAVLAEAYRIPSPFYRMLHTTMGRFGWYRNAMLLARYRFRAPGTTGGSLEQGGQVGR